MQVGILTTNDGLHSADKWALTTTGQIMQAVFSTAAAETIGARKFELELLDILAPHYDKVQKHERGKIEEHGMERLSQPVDPREHCDAVVADIVSAAVKIGVVAVPDLEKPPIHAEDGKPVYHMKDVDLGEHLGRPEARAALAGMVGAHFASAMDIERSWHADRNADHPEARAYRKARTEHGAAHVHAHIHRYREDHKVA